ncbi:MAG: YceI family protein [Thermoanaerobaculia bacterium]|nr:MAG: YceI family protein [Thermoanaerobaculia bacterium]
MLTAALLALALAVPATAATTFSLDPAHSSVSFKVRHFVSKVPGQFTDFSATIVRDDENLANASVEFTIQAKSIDTGNDKRDEHLRSADFFDVAHHPVISFRSQKVEKVSDSLYRVTGPLTMRGVTKVVTLDVEFAGEIKDPWGGTRAGFSTSTKLDRREFNVLWNKALDTGGFMLSDEVEVAIELEAVKN